MSMILALVLASGAQSDTAEVTLEEVSDKIVTCIDYVEGRTSAQDVINKYQLDTDRKKRDFQLACMMSIESARAGFNIGVKEALKPNT